MIRDNRSDNLGVIAFEPQVVNTDTTTNGAVIDTADYHALTFIMSIAWTAGDLTPIVQMADNLAFSTNVENVPDANLLGDVASGQEADANLNTAKLISRLGVVNQQRRYIRLSFLSANSANVVASAVASANTEVAPKAD